MKEQNQENKSSVWNRNSIVSEEKWMFFVHPKTKWREGEKKENSVSNVVRITTRTRFEHKTIKHWWILVMNKEDKTYERKMDRKWDHEDGKKGWTSVTVSDVKSLRHSQEWEDKKKRLGCVVTPGLTLTHNVVELRM